jgi:hypothetical protein
MINCDHYRQIAEAATINGTNYDTMAAQYEAGTPIETVLLARGRNILPTDGEWCWMEEAARLMGVSYTTLVSTGMTNSYAGLDTKSASKTGKGVRGAGRLIRRSDAKEVGRIRRELHVSLIVGLKIMQAKKDGVL